MRRDRNITSLPTELWINVVSVVLRTHSCCAPTLRREDLVIKHVGGICSDILFLSLNSMLMKIL